VKLFPFNSKIKKMTTVVKKNKNTYTAFVIGESEYILNACTKFCETDCKKTK